MLLPLSGVVVAVVVMMVRMVMSVMMRLVMRLLRVHLQLVSEQSDTSDQRVPMSSGFVSLRFEPFDAPCLDVDNPIPRFAVVDDIHFV
jgi:hypothetical protein